MNKICKQYIKQVKTLFPIMGEKERTYIKNLTSNLEDFCEEESIQSLDELYSQFGDPVDTLNNYFSSIDTPDIIKKINIRKWKKKIIFCTCILISCCAIFLCIYYYNIYKIFEREQVLFTDTITTIE